MVDEDDASDDDPQSQVDTLTLNQSGRPKASDGHKKDVRSRSKASNALVRSHLQIIWKDLHLRIQEAVSETGKDASYFMHAVMNMGISKTRRS